MKGICIMSEMKKDREELNWKEKYQKEHKLRQEAETETILVKGIGMNSPEMRDLKGKLTETEVILNGTKKIVEESFKKVRQMQQELDRVKEENNNLYNRIADALEVNESHQKLNGKLQERLTDLDEENKKLHEHVEKQVSGARKSGM
tara:strand:- start:117 stop:557 length:441 start_codon:yes stop_codon:yes gene_type:complete